MDQVSAHRGDSVSAELEISKLVDNGWRVDIKRVDRFIYVARAFKGERAYVSANSTIYWAMRRLCDNVISKQ